MSKVRLDLLLVERDLVESRNQAQKLIMAGQVRVDDQIVLKPSTKVLPDAALAVDQGPRYVSRGGDKLAAALDSFQFDVKGLVCADVGASHSQGTGAPSTFPITVLLWVVLPLIRIPIPSLKPIQ